MTKVHYVWDSMEDNIVRELDDAGAVVADYTTEPDHFGNVLSQRRSGESRFFHYDGQGSTIAVTDEHANITDTRAYAAFGETTASTGSTVFPFQYIGQQGYYTDSATGGLLVRRRAYKPQRGRWISLDPLYIVSIEDRGHQAHFRQLPIALYVYARNNPIIFIDPSGLQEQPAEQPPKFAKCEALPPIPKVCVDNTSSTTDVALCARPIKNKPIGCHVYLKITCGDPPDGVFSFGGVEGKICEQCKDKCMDGQLRMYFGTFKKDEMPPNPDFPEGDTLTHICEYYKVKRSPKDVFDCMKEVSRRIRECCIEYDWTAVGKPELGCNSNCAAWWIAQLCFTPLEGDAVIELPKDRPVGCLGWKKEMPDCVKDPKPK